jgi:hypothetical protein
MSLQLAGPVIAFETMTISLSVDYPNDCTKPGMKQSVGRQVRKSLNWPANWQQGEKGLASVSPRSRRFRDFMDQMIPGCRLANWWANLPARA